MTEFQAKALDRIKVAKETMIEADVLIANDSIRGSVNRLYYAGFYAVTAYMYFLEVEEGTHKRMKYQFNLLLVSTNLIDRKSAKIFNKLAIIRNDSDYHDYNSITKEEVTLFHKSVTSIINSVEKLIAV